MAVLLLSREGLPVFESRPFNNGCLRNKTKQRSCLTILTVLKNVCLANAVELNIYFLVSIMTVTKGLNQMQGSSLIMFVTWEEQRELNVEIINASLTGFCCLITQNVFFFLFKRLS